MLVLFQSPLSSWYLLGSPVSQPLSFPHVSYPLIPRYLVEEIKKREGFELVMEVGLLDPLNARPP